MHGRRSAQRNVRCTGAFAALRTGHGIRRLIALLTAPVIGIGPGIAPVTVAAATGAIAAVTLTAAAAPALASTSCADSGSVLVFPDSVNGGSASAEATEAAAIGCAVTMFSSSDVSGMSQAQMVAYFGGFAAIIIGDPSTSACASTVPSDALSYASDWGPAIDGNVAVLGTAPVLAGSAGSALLDDALTWVTSGGSTVTGLYVSLNCEYSSAAADTPVPLLADVSGGGFAVTGRSGSCPSNSGTINAAQALADSPFIGLTGTTIGPWSSPACALQETFNTWSGGLTGLGYDAGVTPATFMASNATTGQPYLLTGTVSPATLALSPSTGGQVPGDEAFGGRNPAAPGVSAATAGDPVNTEDGDFTQSNTNLSIPTFGPSLDFTATYDAQLARQQTIAGAPVGDGAPGSMGYGWTDTWDSSLATNQPVPGDLYTVDGTRTDNGNGGAPTSAPMADPGSVYLVNNNVYIADSAENRILEIPGTSGTQWGISMTAGDEYVIAGSATGLAGRSDGTPASSSLLDDPEGIAVDTSGNLYIADTGNNRVVEVPAVSGINRGFGTLSENYLYTIAGHGTGAPGHGGDNGIANDAFLDQPYGVAVQYSSGDLYIADSGNNRIQEVPAEDGGQWGVSSMTADYIYTVAGNSSGSAGISGDGGSARSAYLNQPDAVALSSAGDLYIADTGNNRIQEVPASAGAQWGITPSFSQYDIYTIAGSATGSSGHSGNGTTNTSALLNEPNGLKVDNGTQLYITDLGDNRIEEVAHSGHTEWGITMTQNKIYTIAGTGTAGFSGNGGSAVSAKLDAPLGAALDSSFNLYIADSGNNRIREVSESTGDISAYAGTGTTLNVVGDGSAATTAAVSAPGSVAADAEGDIFIADAGNNRVQEISASNHTQFGISMTAGDTYTVAGSAAGTAGRTTTGGLATSALLDDPQAVAVDPAGDLYIADTGNNRVMEVAASTGGGLTDGYIYLSAGSLSGGVGVSGDGGPATLALLDSPVGLAFDSSGDLFIADQGNSRIQEIPASSGGGMTAGYIYTVAGSASGVSGSSGDLGLATSADLDDPAGVTVDSSGDLFIADSGNDRVQEVAAASSTQWGQSMTAGHIYTVAGSAGGGSGSNGDSGPAVLAQLDYPFSVAVDSSGDLFIADALNNRVQEVAAADGTQWGQSMTANDIYTVAGSATGSSGSGGEGGTANVAEFNDVRDVAIDPSGDFFITDQGNNELDEVISAVNSPFGVSPAGTGVTVTQADGSQVTFYPETGGSCAAPYQSAGSGGYCTLSQNVSATLSYSSSGGGTYTYSPDPGDTYTYGANGALETESDAAGNTLSLSYGSPAPGSGNCPSAANWCQTVTSASGRALTIGYNSADLITSVTDPMGREWTYGYSGSDLVFATDPMGNKTSYTYGAGSTGNPQLANDLLTITEPNAQPGGPNAGDDTVNVYDSYGRVIKQTDPMGWVTNFNYCVSSNDGDCLNSATGTGSTTVTDPDGNTIVDSYSLGSLIGQAQLTGGSTLSSAESFAPDQTSAGTSAGTQLDSASVDGDNNVTTMSYDANGNPVTDVSPDGVGSQLETVTQQFTGLSRNNCSSTESTTCTTASGPAAVTPGGVITPPSSIPPQGITWRLYDTNGNALYSTTGVYQPGSSSASYAQTTYQLFDGNSVTLSGTNISCSATPPSPSLPCATINADGVVTQLAYNSDGDLVSSTTPDGNGSQLATTTYGYNADGEQTSEVSPDGNLTGANTGNYTTNAVFNADGEQTSVTEAAGTGATVTPRTTTYGYDADGNQTTMQDARGYTTTTGYNADDEPTLVTDPLGNATLTCYDGDGNVAQTVPAVGVAANSLSAASCPMAYPAGYSDRLAFDSTVDTYDSAGDLVEETTPAPAGQSGYQTTTYSYDGNGNLTETTAPAAANGGSSQVTVDTYNADNELASETTGSGSSVAATTSYCYDPSGDLTSVVYADGNTAGIAACETSSPWDVSATSYPTQAAYQTTYGYDSAGELVSTTTPATSAAPSGATTTSTYDPAGNMLTATDPNGVTTTWTYTPANYPATVSYSGSSAHSVSYGYDANGTRTAMSDGTGSSSYVIDPFGELTSATNGAGQTTGYSYNADGQVASIVYPLPSGASWATSDTVTYAYDHADDPTSVTDFNGNSITIGDTADGLPSSLALGSTGDTITTSYDNTDSPSEISLKNSSSTVLQSFTYTDAPDGSVLNETDTPSSSNSPAVYTYDAQGRITSMTPGSGSTLSYGFDPAGNLTTLPGAATPTYDKAGELTAATLSGTTTSYTYNADGQQLTGKQGSTTITSGSWNGAGRLTAYSDPSAAMTAASYDGDGLRASATTSAGTQSFNWDLASAAPQLLMDSNNAYIYSGGGSPVEQVNLSTGAVEYLVTDLLGSVRGVVSSSGALTSATSYDAWGNAETTGGLTSYTPFGFAGGYTDPTGLIYLISRYYNPLAGQFLSVDPDLDETLDPYSYADGNPVTQTDPTGEESKSYKHTFSRDYGHHSETITKDLCEDLKNYGILGTVACVVGQVVNNIPRGRVSGTAEWDKQQTGIIGLEGIEGAFHVIASNSGYDDPQFLFTFFRRRNIHHNRPILDWYYVSNYEEKNDSKSWSTGWIETGGKDSPLLFNSGEVMNVILFAESSNGTIYPVNQYPSGAFYVLNASGE